jgi:hypothetical protein
LIEPLQFPSTRSQALQRTLEVAQGAQRIVGLGGSAICEAIKEKKMSEKELEAQVAALAAKVAELERANPPSPTQI